MLYNTGHPELALVHINDLRPAKPGKPQVALRLDHMHEVGRFLVLRKAVLAAALEFKNDDFVTGEVAG